MAKHKSIVEKYRIVFGTETGKEVLTDILAGMGFFHLEEISPEALALHNQAKIILQKCGLLNYRKREELLDSWFKLPFEIYEEGEKDYGDPEQA